MFKNNLIVQISEVGNNNDVTKDSCELFFLSSKLQVQQVGLVTLIPLEPVHMPTPTRQLLSRPVGVCGVNWVLCCLCVYSL